MAAGNFWVRYAQQFLDFNLNSLMTVELRMVLSITLRLYGSHTEIDQMRTTTILTSEVAIGYMSLFKQKSGLLSGLRIRYTLYPWMYAIRQYGISVRVRTFSVYVKEIHLEVHQWKGSYPYRTGSSLCRAGSDVSESYLETT